MATPSTPHLTHHHQRGLLGLRRVPGRLAVWVFRFPLRLYRRGWGWMLGRTFLMFEHIGRRTGKRHQAVAMVLADDPLTGELVICSGWGPHVDWVRNLRGRSCDRGADRTRSLRPRHRFLPEDEAVAVGRAFARHGGRLRLVSTILGWGDLSTDQAIRAFVQDIRSSPSDVRPEEASKRHDRDRSTVDAARRSTQPLPLPPRAREVYASSPERAVTLQRQARTLHALADRWASAIPSTAPPLSPYAGADDLNDPAALQLEGVLFMEGEGEPAELTHLLRDLRTTADDYLGTPGQGPGPSALMATSTCQWCSSGVPPARRARIPVVAETGEGPWTDLAATRFRRGVVGVVLRRRPSGHDSGNRHGAALRRRGPRATGPWWLVRWEPSRGGAEPAPPARRKSDPEDRLRADLNNDHDLRWRVSSALTSASVTGLRRNVSQVSASPTPILR